MRRLIDGQVSRVEVVRDRQAECPVIDGDADQYLGGLRVLHDVVDGLLERQVQMAARVGVELVALQALDLFYALA